MDFAVSYQRIAVSCILKLAKDMDIRCIRSMLAQMPEELLDVSSMKKFLECFGQVRTLTEIDILKKKFRDKEIGTLVYDGSKKMKLADALETPWGQSR